MATTTNYSWSTPDDTALVKDGALAIRTLGSSIDTTTKNLNPSTTLGDIEYRSSTANTNTRLGIGTTGQVLTVSGGVPAWAAASAGSFGLITPTSTANSGGTVSTSGGAVTASAVNSVSLNGVFSSTYNNYMILINSLTGSTSGNVYMRLRASGSDTTTNYKWAYSYMPWTGGNPAGGASNGATEWSVGLASSTTQVGQCYVLESPNVAEDTSVQYKNTYYDGSIFGSGTQTDSTQFDGFSFYPQSGTLSAVIRVYGLAN